MILLTDEEMDELGLDDEVFEFRNKDGNEYCVPTIAKAQLKKVVEQIQKIGAVMPKGVRGNGEHLYVVPLEYYKALLEETG